MPKIKKFILEVSEGATCCGECPFFRNEDICIYLSENKICDEFNFNSAHLEELNEEL